MNRGNKNSSPIAPSCGRAIRGDAMSKELPTIEEAYAEIEKTIRRIKAIEVERDALQYEIPIKGGGETYPGAIRRILTERDEAQGELAQSEDAHSEVRRRLVGTSGEGVPFIDDAVAVALKALRDEVERLRDTTAKLRVARAYAKTEHAEALAEVERLREALGKIEPACLRGERASYIADIARAALTKGEKAVDEESLRMAEDEIDHADCSRKAPGAEHGIASRETVQS